MNFNLCVKKSTEGKWAAGGHNPSMLPLALRTVETLEWKKATAIDSIMTRAHMAYTGLACMWDPSFGSIFPDIFMALGVGLKEEGEEAAGVWSADELGVVLLKVVSFQLSHSSSQWFLQTQSEGEVQRDQIFLGSTFLPPHCSWGLVSAGHVQRTWREYTVAASLQGSLKWFLCHLPLC